MALRHVSEAQPNSSEAVLIDDMRDSSLPRWFTPKRMLCIFTGMSVIVYLDRGLIGSTPVNGRAESAKLRGNGIQGDFGLTNFQDGCLPAAFMVGLLVACPVFVQLAKTHQTFKLVGVGLLIWFMSVFASGLSWDFWSLLFCRTAVGAGEASFVILAAPFIAQVPCVSAECFLLWEIHDDRSVHIHETVFSHSRTAIKSVDILGTSKEYAPPALKSIWLSIFLMAIPVGYALGYIYGAIVGSYFGWRIAFLSEATLMLPFVVFSFLTRPVPLGKGLMDSGPDLSSSPLRSTSPLSYPTHPDASMHPNVPASDAAVSDGGEVIHSARSIYSTQHDSQRSSRYGKSASGVPPRNMSPVLPPAEGRDLLEAATERLGGTSGDGDGESPVWATGSGSGHGNLDSEWVGTSFIVSHRGAPGLQAPLKTQVKWMLRQRVYTLTILGNTVHTALLGMFAYWGPKGATLIFRMLPGQADLVFGLVTVTTGILGTLSGGWVLDKLGGNAHAAGRVCFMAISAGFLLLQLGFIFTTTFGAFVSVFAVGQFALFMLQAPMTRIILLSAPVHLQPLAFSIQTIMIHVLGDVPSPPLAGWIHDHIFEPDDSIYPNSWRWTCIVMICILTIAMGLFASVTIMTRPRHTLPPVRVSDVAFNALGARSTSETRPMFTDENLPPVETLQLQKEGIGSLGLPKKLKDYFVSTASDNMDRTAAVGEGVSGTSSIGHVPGCVDSSAVLLLVDSHEHLQAVDEAGSSESRASAFQTSHDSSSGSLLER